MEDVELPEPSQAAALADSVDGQVGDAMDEAQTKAAAAVLQVRGSALGCIPLEGHDIPFHMTACQSIWSGPLLFCQPLLESSHDSSGARA